MGRGRGKKIKSEEGGGTKNKNTGQYTGIMQVVWSEIMAWINVVFSQNTANNLRQNVFHPGQA